MNIIETIQTALDALNNNADLFLLEKARAENKELENTTDTIIVYPDWRTTSQFNQALEISKTRVYNIDFKTLDEWDNADDDTVISYDSRTSVDRIEEMAILANSVFWWITSNKNQFPEIREKLKWTEPRPILRANNGTMSGVSVQLTVVFNGEKVCSYTPIIPEPTAENILSAVSYQDVLTEVGVLMSFVASKSINFGDGDPDEQLITDVEKTYNYTYLGRYDINVLSLEADTTKLVFDHSKLIELNIDKLTGLTYLDLDTNSLPNFSISRFTELTYLDLSNNNILSANVDEVIRLLDNFGKSNGTLLIASGNEANTETSNDAVTNLVAKGWSVDVNYLGSELVISWEFNSDVGWILTTNWSISGGKLRAIQDVSAWSRQENVAMIGKDYLVKIKVDSVSASGLSVSLGSTSNRIPIITSAGTYSGILIADGARLSINPQFDFHLDAEIDYISVKEIL